MYTGFWSEFTILLIAVIFGSIAILPYSLRLLKESKKELNRKMPKWVLYALSISQNAILFSIAIALGLILAHQIGIGAPLIDNFLTHSGVNYVISSLLIPLILGLFGGSALLLMDLKFLPYLPEKLLRTALKTTQWENFTASFYGGINEELLMRLFGVSLIAWVLEKIWHTPSNLPTTIDFYIAIFIMSIIFALGHLPALKSLVGDVSSTLLTRTLILNGAIGLICGWVFWHYGIEAAILAHFTADIVYHVGGTYVLRMKFKQI